MIFKIHSHIGILIFYSDRAKLRLIPLIYSEHRVLHEFFSRCESVEIVVSYKELETRVVALRYDLIQIVEALVTFRRLGTLVRRQKIYKLRCHERRVDHDAFRASRVHASPAYLDGRRGSIEALILEYAELAAVNRVRLICMESVHVEKLGSVASLLIGCEGYCDAAVRHVRIIYEVCQHLHYLGNARLIVSTK